MIYLGPSVVICGVLFSKAHKGRNEEILKKKLDAIPPGEKLQGKISGLSVNIQD